MRPDKAQLVHQHILEGKRGVTKFRGEGALTYHQLRARRALPIFKDIPLKTRKELSLYKVCGDSALLLLNGTSLNNDSSLLALV